MSQATIAKPKKSVTRTIRIEDDIDHSLEELATKEGLSVNFLVNKALRKYVEWDYLAGKYGVASNFTAADKKLMNYLSDAEVKDFGKWVGQNLFREYVTFWFKTVDLESVLKAIKLLSVAGNFQYDEYVNSNTRSIICKHDSGHKWSLYYEEVFRRVFKDLVSTDVKIDSTDNQVLVQVPTSREAFLDTLYDEIQKGRKINPALT